MKKKKRTLQQCLLLHQDRQESSLTVTICNDENIQWVQECTRLHALNTLIILQDLSAQIELRAATKTTSSQDMGHVWPVSNTQMNKSGRPDHEWNRRSTLSCLLCL